MKEPTKGRSNRPLTAFACKALERFLTGEIQHEVDVTRNNTRVKIVKTGSINRFTVALFDEDILVVTLSDGKPLSICVSFTSFYDSHGQPSSTTAERLNGLLDRLGVFGLIPKGVRLFRDQEYHTTYIGKGDDKVAIGRNLIQSVNIKPVSNQLIFSGFTARLQKR